MYYSAEDQEESRISVDKSHELCANAANRITTIGKLMRNVRGVESFLNILHD